MKNVEIFFNSASELEGEIFSYVRSTVNDYNMNVISVHPFSSPMETLFLFSSYDRRLVEIMDLYKRHFEMMSKLNAKVFVVHGAIASAKCPDERYVERLSGLIEAGHGLGITVAQENVSYCKSGKPEFLQFLYKELSSSIAFVLDIKQARRSGVQPMELLETIGDKIVHVHLSDGVNGDKTRDCLLIGEGDFDFAAFFALLNKKGYKGDAVVELYRENYSDYSQLSDSVERLEKLLKGACN
ncbi:MAG: sugar phosphate isomerase/epimerase [Oscillospiraceae bacterium]|nr:sugar phosphate isomerase/epimerase [Oscillospiraceae bacterium]